LTERSASKIMILEQVLRELRTEKELSRLNWQRLHRVFGSRFTKAWSLVTERRLKKYVFRPSGRAIWVAVGNSAEYLIYPHAGYCSCSDFYFRVLDEDTAVCYHVLAQKIAEVLGYYDVVLEEDEAYRELMDIWKLYARLD